MALPVKTQNQGPSRTATDKIQTSSEIPPRVEKATHTWQTAEPQLKHVFQKHPLKLFTQAYKKVTHNTPNTHHIHADKRKPHTHTFLFLDFWRDVRIMRKILDIAGNPPPHFLRACDKGDADEWAPMLRDLFSTPERFSSSPRSPPSLSTQMAFSMEVPMRGKTPFHWS